MESIIAAVISGAITLLGVMVANGRNQAVTETKLDELTRDLQKECPWLRNKSRSSITGC